MAERNVTCLLDAAARGDPRAASELLPLVYEELRKLAAQRLAHEKPGQTLQATALVHEAYVRLVEVDPAKAPQQFNGRGHFFAAAAEAMRRILIDNARRHAALRHGGGQARVNGDDALAAVAAPALDDRATDPADLVSLDAALTKLESEDKPRADLVKLHYFVGLSLEDAAEALGISRATAYRQWNYTRAWLHHEIGAQGS